MIKVNQPKNGKRSDVMHASKLFFLVMLLSLMGLVTNSYSSNSRQQAHTVSGKVSDQNGEFLTGVSVIIKGTTKGVITDAAGNYTLSDVPDNSTLVFSFLGMKTQEINVGSRTTVNVVMNTETYGINEVVVTGVGVATSKRNLAISVEAVNAEKLPQEPTASIDQALVGKIPGAQISTIDGTPGSQVNILLRGINSVSGGTLPMILIDGVQVAATNLNSLDLSTIDRVEVVQGAASATIYGAQGANGVIQLFTKKGAKNGKVNVDISSSIANNAYLNVGGVRKAKLHGFVTDANNNVIDGDGNPLVFDPEGGYANNLIWLSTNPQTQTNKPYNANLKYYDHFKMFFTDAYTHNNAITISGGQDQVDASFTLSNNHQESNLRYGGYYNRTNLTANIGLD
jgi:outer membrane cobalamin receptor